MTDNNDKKPLDLGTDVGSAASERKARASRNLGKVVSFATADSQVHVYEDIGNGVMRPKLENDSKVLREDADADMAEIVAKMTKFMEAIDKAPDDFDAINSFGADAVKKIGVASQNSINVQKKFNGSLNTMKAAQDELEKSGFKEFVEGGKKLLTAGKDAGAATLSGIGKLFNKMFAKKEKEEDKSEATRAREELDKTLPKMMQSMNTILAKIERSDVSLVEVIKEARSFGFQQYQASNELALYIGCREEVLRRYDEIYIPEAEDILMQSGQDNAEAQQYLTDVVQRRSDFNDRILILTQAKSSCDNGAAMLHQQINAMQDQRKVVRQTMDTAKPIWEAQLANLGIISSSLRQAELNNQVSELSNSLFTANMDLSEKAIRMTIEAKNKGIVDYDKLIEQAERIENLIGECAQAEKDHQNLIAAQTDSLLATNNRLIDAAAEAKGVQANLIDSTPSNDNAAPVAKKAASPRGPRKSK